MYSEVTDYQSLKDFSKSYTKVDANGKVKKGVSRQYIYELLEKEKKQPGSTGLDFMKIGNNHFVRKTPKG